MTTKVEPPNISNTRDCGEARKARHMMASRGLSPTSRIFASGPDAVPSSDCSAIKLGPFPRPSGLPASAREIHRYADEVQDASPSARARWPRSPGKPSLWEGHVAAGEPEVRIRSPGVSDWAP